MKLDDIGFYTLTDARAKNVAECYKDMALPYSRCEIIITKQCNFACPYCRGIECTEMSLDTMKQTIDTLGGVKNIRFSGGEPTMNPHLLDAVKYASEKGVERIAISTNGSRSFMEYQKLINAGVNDFSISLDACCSSTGDMMAGNKAGAWNRVVDNIRKLSSITYVTVGVVITEENLNDVKSIINFADMLGVSDIRVIPSAQYNKFLDTLKLVSPRIYSSRPILKYRVGQAIAEKHVRGLTDNDVNRCPLVLDDIAIKGNDHYPCIIYMRENGAPIGKITDGADKIREDRIAWFQTHDTKCDGICNKNCLDVCVEYNNTCASYIDGVLVDSYDKIE